MIVALYPGLLAPAFVACSTNMGDGLVELITCSGIPSMEACTFLLYSCKAAFWTQERRQDCLMSSTQSFYGPCLWSLAHSHTCGFLGMCHSSTRPGTSLHMISFTKSFPTIVLQATITNTWVKRPGYEAKVVALYGSYCNQPTNNEGWRAKLKSTTYCR